MSFTELNYLKTCLGCIQEAGEGTTGYRMRRWHSNASSGFLLIQGAEHGGHCPGTLACRYHSIVLPLTCLDAMLLREGRGWRAFRTGCLQGHPMQSRLCVSHNLPSSHLPRNGSWEGPTLDWSHLQCGPMFHDPRAARGKKKVELKAAPQSGVRTVALSRSQVWFHHGKAGGILGQFPALAKFPHQ